MSRAQWAATLAMRYETLMPRRIESRGSFFRGVEVADQPCDPFRLVVRGSSFERCKFDVDRDRLRRERLGFLDQPRISARRVAN